MLEVFSTAREVRNFYENFLGSNILVPKAITIADFESKVWCVPGLIAADSDTRTILMQEAVKFENFSKLNIPTEFMAFLQNSNYIFSFFEELSHENIDIDKLLFADIYSEYNEHILILKETLSRYSSLLDENGLYDVITLPLKAKLNTTYLQSLKKIRIHIEGYLNKFEQNLLEHIQSYCEVSIVTPITKYNNNIKKWLLKHKLDLANDNIYECLLNNQQIVNSKKIENKTKQIIFQSFSSRILQTSFIFEQIEKMVKDGISPEKIAVVLPDENFTEILSEFDRFKNLNFAMGRSIKFSLYFKKLDSILKYFNEQNIETSSRLKKYNISQETMIFLQQETNVQEIVDWLESFIDRNDIKESIDVIKEELFVFKRFLLKLKNSLNNSEALTLFLNRLKKRKIDDTSGGKITVIGVLETRGSNFDGLILVDFNDDIVPLRSNKDMFLSSKVRIHSGLPSVEDRENLQRFFYDRAIKNAKFVAICCVQNEEKTPSRFLKNFQIKEKNFNEESYFKILFNKQSQKELFTCEPIIQEYDFFDKPLSSSRLKCFIDCPRKYYFKYVKNYQEAKIPSDDFTMKDFGILLHDALKELFLEGFSSYQDIKNKTKQLLYKKIPNSAIYILNCDIWMLKLEDFFEREIKNQNDGWKIFEVEKKINRKVNDVLLTGVIDRIDVNNNTFQIYDYKTGNIIEELSEEKALKSSNFQLEFYSILCEELGNIKKSLYYKLDGAKLIEDNFFELKKDLLFQHLDTLKKTKEFNFVKTENLSICEYCEYFCICKGKPHEF